MKAAYVTVGVLLLVAAFYLGLVRPPGHSGLALICSIGAAMIFVGCFPGTSGGSPA
jgi:hypothetical protein